MNLIQKKKLKDFSQIKKWKSSIYPKSFYCNNTFNNASLYEQFVLRTKHKLSLENDPNSNNSLDWNLEKDREIIDLLIQAAAQNSTEISKTISNNILSPLGLESSRKSVFNLLIDLGIWKKNENFHLHAYKRILEPNEIVIKEAERIFQKYQQDKQHPQYFSKMERITFDKSIFSIDGSNAQEIDDAISIIKKGNKKKLNSHQMYQ